MTSIIGETFTEIVETIRTEYEKEKKLSEGTLSMLSFLFDFTAVQALDLVDHRCVMLVNSPSGRELYKIQKNATEFHICLKNSNYCTCPSFSFHVLKKDQLMCKHKLAAVLSTAMGLCKEVQYADETVTLMLAGENNSL
ncbi:zinc finger SWIM domain-containing protein 7 [Caerostris darwini]|uniref:Zinc finger SWIM domain-containing protein 7 n=1 Tax=Caerostris darwini TaxID=1538125 RepID=A0AAV4SES6_9ARAC|nr:zinc finger SWIM domain-containing protein 7 [Caerostris darwini]